MRAVGIHEDDDIGPSSDVDGAKLSHVEFQAREVDPPGQPLHGVQVGERRPMPQIGRGTAEGVAPVVGEKQEFTVRGLHSLEAASRQADHARDGWCGEWRVLGRPGNTGAHTEQDAQCQEGMALRNGVHGQHAVGLRRNAHVRKTPKKWPFAADAPPV